MEIQAAKARTVQLLRDSDQVPYGCTSSVGLQQNEPFNAAHHAES